MATATKGISTNAAKQKPRGKAFTGKDDPRRNNHGQRNAAAVATLAETRALYVKILNEKVGTPVDKDMSNLELIVRQQVAGAKKGDDLKREKMFDRIWDKTTQPVDVDGTLRHEHSGSITVEQIRDLSDEDLAERLRDALGEVAETKRRW